MPKESLLTTLALLLKKFFLTNKLKKYEASKGTEVQTDSNTQENLDIPDNFSRSTSTDNSDTTYNQELQSKIEEFLELLQTKKDVILNASNIKEFLKNPKLKQWAVFILQSTDINITKLQDNIIKPEHLKNNQELKTWISLELAKDKLLEFALGSDVQTKFMDNINFCLYSTDTPLLPSNQTSTIDNYAVMQTGLEITKLMITTAAALLVLDGNKLTEKIPNFKQYCTEKQGNIYVETIKSLSDTQKVIEFSKKTSLIIVDLAKFYEEKMRETTKYKTKDTLKILSDNIKSMRKLNLQLHDILQINTTSEHRKPSNPNH